MIFSSNRNVKRGQVSCSRNHSRKMNIFLVGEYEINEIVEMFWMIFENIQISLVLHKWGSGKKCKS